MATPTGPTHARLEDIDAKIQRLDLDLIKFKLVREEGWTQAQSDLVERWYKRFLYMQVKYPERTIVATKAIDTFWHQHILDTRKYAADCDALFGGFLHHYPYFGLRGDEDAANLKAAFADTLVLVEAEFGEPLLGWAAESSSNGATRSPAAGCSDCSGRIDGFGIEDTQSRLAALPSSCSDCAGQIERAPLAAASCSDCAGQIDRFGFNNDRFTPAGLGAMLGAEPERPAPT